MRVQIVCEQAAKWAREQLVYKSANKIRLKGARSLLIKNTDRPEAPGRSLAPVRRVVESSYRQKQVEKEMDARKAQFAFFSNLGLMTPQETAEFAQREERAILGDVLASKAGNCSAYSILALAYIHAHEPKWSATRVSLKGAGGDHVFVAASAVLPFNAANLTWDTKDMEAWPEKVWVCDPWANVVCPANKYYKSFNDKMESWARKDKRILYNSDWIVPTDPKYLKTLSEAEKKFQPWSQYATKPTTKDLEGLVPT